MYSAILLFTDIFFRDLRTNENLLPNACTSGKLALDKTSIDINTYLIDFDERVKIKYTLVPKHYSCMNNWIKTSNLLCWNCHLSFDTIPLFVPVGTVPKANDINPGIKYIIPYGNTCSFGCTMNYIIENNDINIPNKNESRRLLYRILAEVTMDIKIISPHPSYKVLKLYKGHSGITTQEYIQKYRTVKVLIKDHYIYI